MKRVIAIVTIGILSLCQSSRSFADSDGGASAAAVKPAKVKRSLKDRIGPAVKGGGFRTPDYVPWCSSVIKVVDTYHMFASRWLAQYGLAEWTKYSECVADRSLHARQQLRFPRPGLARAAEAAMVQRRWAARSLSRIW